LNEINWERLIKGYGEPEIVAPEPLGGYIRAWIERWERERPGRITDTGSTANFMSAINWLAQETGLHVDRIRRIKSAQLEKVPFRQADKILSAMGESFRIGEDIEVIPNPRWSPELWHQYMSSRGCV
jgi:hypothetical protein